MRPGGSSLVEGSGPGADSPEAGPGQWCSGAGGGGAVAARAARFRHDDAPSLGSSIDDGRPTVCTAAVL